MCGICSRLPGTQHHMPTAVLLSVWLWGHPAPSRGSPVTSAFVPRGFLPRPGGLLRLCRHSWRDPGLASGEQPQPVWDKSWWSKHPDSLIRGHPLRACYLVPQRVYCCPTAVCSAVHPSPPFYIFSFSFTCIGVWCTAQWLGNHILLLSI